MPDAKKALCVFDFDDTVAKTTGKIGFSFLKDGQPWEGAEDHLRGLGASFEAVNDGRMDVFFIPVEELPKVEHLLDALHGEGGIEVEKDFSDFASIDRDDYEIKPGIARWLKLAKQQGAEVVVLTARAGDGMNLKSLLNPAGVNSTNSSDIRRVIQQELGADVPVYAVGAPGADTAVEKRKVMGQLIDRIRPDVVHFWDDSDRNLQAVMDLCGKAGAKLVCHRVSQHADRIEVSSTCESFLSLFPA